MRLSRQRRQRSYQVYGLRVKSAIQLDCPAATKLAAAETELVGGSASHFSRVSVAAGIRSEATSWFQHAALADGSHYLRWSGFFEFLVEADGRKITCRPLNGVSREVFRTYLLGHVLSFALLKRGIESLHSTAVVIDEGVVGFVGDCGYGKSSLGAAFLQAGCRLLTDDLLVVREDRDGFVASPGLPRIKLFPEIAKSLLGEQISGTPMNHLTPKLIIPLPRSQFCTGPAPLKAVYVLKPLPPGAPRKRIVIRPLSGRAAFFELLKNTFNPVIVEPARLQRQFHLATQLASQVLIKSVSFPRGPAHLRAVRQAIESDLVA